MKTIALFLLWLVYLSIIFRNNYKLKIYRSNYANTNAQVGHSVTGISFSGNFGPKSKEEVNDLVNAFGSVIEVDEDHLHQVTAITGSGPAFYIMSLNNMLKQVQI